MCVCLFHRISHFKHSPHLYLHGWFLAIQAASSWWLASPLWQNQRQNTLGIPPQYWVAPALHHLSLSMSRRKKCLSPLFHLHPCFHDWGALDSRYINSLCCRFWGEQLTFCALLFIIYGLLMRFSEPLLKKSPLSVIIWVLNGNERIRQHSLLLCQMSHLCGVSGSGMFLAN